MNVPGGPEFGRDDPNDEPRKKLPGECNNEVDAGAIIKEQRDKFPLFFRWFPTRHAAYFSDTDGWNKDKGDCFGVVIELPFCSNSTKRVPSDNGLRTNDYVKPFAKDRAKPTMDALIGAEHTYCSWASAMSEELQPGEMSSPMIERLFTLAMNHKNNPAWMVKKYQPLNKDGTVQLVPMVSRNHMRQVHVVDARNTMDATDRGLEGFKGVLQNHWGKLTHYGPVIVVMPAHFLVNGVFGFGQTNYNPGDFDDVGSNQQRHARAHPCRYGLMRLYDLLRPLHGGLGFPVLLVVIDIVECKHTVNDNEEQVHKKYPCFQLQKKTTDSGSSTCRVLTSKDDEENVGTHEACEYDDVVWAEIVSQFRAELNATDVVSEIVCEKYRPSTDDRKDMWEQMKKLGGRFRAHIFQMTYSREMYRLFDEWKDYRDERGDVPEPQLLSRDCERVTANESFWDARVDGSSPTAYGPAAAPHYGVKSETQYGGKVKYTNPNDDSYGKPWARTIMHPQDRECPHRPCKKYVDVDVATDINDANVDALIGSARMREAAYSRPTGAGASASAGSQSGGGGGKGNASADQAQENSGRRRGNRARSSGANWRDRSSGANWRDRGAGSNITGTSRHYGVTDEVFAAYEQRAAH